MGTKGLKQSVAEAMAEPKAELPPVNVSGEALRALSTKVREWTGDRNARLTLGVPPSKSPWAAWNSKSKMMYANIDAMLRNPNRVLLTVTPFRLRQEAVLTGAMLHEAAHARHSMWMLSGTAPLHSDGTPVTMQEAALAEVMEEARIEGLMARDADKVGAAGLGWTMRAMAAAAVPTTKMHLTNPGQRVMDVLTSWALRAGRQIALAHHTTYDLPNWVGDYNALLHKVFVAHLTMAPSTGEDSDLDPNAEAMRALTLLLDMLTCTDDRGPEMVDLAREVLAILFPETDGDSPDAPMPGDPHEQDDDDEDEAPEDEDSDDGEGDQSPEQDEDGDESAEQDDEPGDERSEDEEGQDDESDSDGGDSDDDGDASDSDDESEDGDGDDDSDDDGDDHDGDGDSDSDGDSDGDDGDEGVGASPSTDAADPIAEALAELEAMAASATTDETDELADEAPAMGAGAGSQAGGEGGWRNPSSVERQVGNDAGRFMRELIDPSEVSKRTLNETPSATIDGAAHAAWKAGGQRRDPRFFVRTQRQVMPSPPVKVAILVDVSASMEELQEPSALLSWALASAALDLRNFAGRGQQIESTLIHWGNTARVIQANGAPLPGIREYDCNEGTSAMDRAMALVEEQIPGFFDEQSTPTNRLLVQFTDWELWGRNGVTPWIQRAMESGVNMVSVVPQAFSPRYSVLDGIMKDCKVQRGKSSLIKYNPKNPGAVWTEALHALT
jgi:hypothetical protein